MLIAKPLYKSPWPMG